MDAPQTRVDAVVVAYNSRRTLRACVEPLAALDGVDVVVVENASPEDSLPAVADLDVETVRARHNRGFAAGSNLGIAQGSARYVLLLNPDAQIDEPALRTLVTVLEDNPTTALVAPRIVEADGTLAYSLRRFPRRRSTFAQALFLHRLWPHASWSDELVRDAAVYERPDSPEWVSGACMLIRRTALAGVGGLDERFFLYCEDVDLCARLRAAGHEIRYEPRAVVRHAGGGSAPREELLAIYACNRIVYARKHGSGPAAALEGVGVALGHLTHAFASIAHPAALRGNLRALAAVARECLSAAMQPKEVR